MGVGVSTRTVVEENKMKGDQRHWTERLIAREAEEAGSYGSAGNCRMSERPARSARNCSAVHSH